MTRPELARVPGVPETLLSEALLATLPDNLAEAPWTVTASALVWAGRAGAAAADALPPGVRALGRPVVVVGGLVRYVDTPVGPYDEVTGVVGLRRGRRSTASVAFMAVDSEASLVGGRTNWAMPKALARFDGTLAGGQSMAATSADGPHWRVAATPRLLGPAVPFRRRAEVVQEFPDGSVRPSTMHARGRARAALVTVEVDSDGPLPTWLRRGRHVGALVEGLTLTLDTPS